MNTYGFCKIFVRETDTETIMAMLAHLLGGTFQRQSMALPGLIVDVLANPDAGASAIDFVRWQVSVELETDESQDPQPMVGTAARILTALRGSGSPAVAACDFESRTNCRGAEASAGYLKQMAAYPAADETFSSATYTQVRRLAFPIFDKLTLGRWSNSCKYCFQVAVTLKVNFAVLLPKNLDQHIRTMPV